MRRGLRAVDGDLDLEACRPCGDGEGVVHQQAVRRDEFLPSPSRPPCDGQQSVAREERLAAHERKHRTPRKIGSKVFQEPEDLVGREFVTRQRAGRVVETEDAPQVAAVRKVNADDFESRPLRRRPSGYAPVPSDDARLIERADRLPECFENLAAGAFPRLGQRCRKGWNRLRFAEGGKGFGQFLVGDDPVRHVAPDVKGSPGARLDKVGRRTGVAGHAQFPGVGSAVPGGGRASGGSGAGASSAAGTWLVA